MDTMPYDYAWRFWHQFAFFRPHCSLSPMWEIEAIVRSLIWQLVSKDYEGLVKRCPCSPMTADEIRLAIQQYGRTFIMPPTSGYERLLHTYQIEDVEYSAWHIEAPLWTEQEGRSDLEISLRIEFKDEAPQIAILNIRVL